MATGHTFIDGHPAGANGRVRWWTGSKQVYHHFYVDAPHIFGVCVNLPRQRANFHCASIFAGSFAVYKDRAE